jgi:ankyrin repeat protein
LNGDVAITKFLLDKGASYAEQDNHGWTALRWATAKQHPDVIMAFLDHHTKVVSSDETSAPKLLKHSTLKDILHLKTVENKPLIELINETGATDLTENTFEDLFTRMQDASFDAAKLWKSGYFDPPVGNAWRTQRKAEYLRTDFYLRRPPSMESKKWNSALVHRAIRDGNLMALKLLLELGTDINTIVDRTPLHAAAFRRDPTFAQVLIENGSDIEALDYQGMTPLQQAVVNGFEETAEFLLSKGANINACNPSDGRTGPKKYKLTSSKGPASCRTPLMLACGLDGKSKDPDISVRMVRMLLKAGADVNQKDALPEQMSAIHYAIRAEEPSLIETIIEAGADPRALDSLGRTGIHHLVLGSRWKDSQYERRDNLAKCFKILRKRCGLDYLSRSAAWEESHPGPNNSYQQMMTIYTPIALAIRSGHWELFHKLHNLGARFETNAPLAGMMRESLIALQVDAVDILMTHGASVPSNHDWIKNNVTLRPGYKTTPDKIQRLIKILPKVLPAGFDEKDRELGAWLLHMAATKENTIELVRELLNLRADPFARGDGGMDSFITAWIYQQYDILRVLLAHAKKSPNEKHWTSHLNSLEVSEEAEVAEEICRALKKAGSIDSVCHPSTLLCEAAVMGIPLIIETLLKHGADPSLVNEKGLSPLHLAASMGYVDCVKKLIEAEVNLNQRNSTKRTALHLAAEAGHTEVVELLVSNGADLGATDTDGWQPLHFASIRERKDIAKCLIHSGASVLAPTIRWSQELVSRRPSGFSLQQPWIGNPLHLAVMSGDVDIVKEILATHEVDVNARVDDSQHENSGVPIIPGAGPTALRIALDTGSFDRKYGRALDRTRLEIAALLVEHGADVQGAGDHLTVADVRRFEEFEELWDKIRIGITDTN